MPDESTCNRQSANVYVLYLIELVWATGDIRKPYKCRVAAVITQPPGKQVLYVIWQRLDPIGEGFYALADVDFGQSVNPTDV